MGNLWNREPAMILAFVGSVLTLLIAFGTNLSKEQMGAILAVTSSGLGLITRSQVTSPQGLQDLKPSVLKAAQDASEPVKETVKKLP